MQSFRGFLNIASPEMGVRLVSFEFPFEYQPKGDFSESRFEKHSEA